MFETWVLLGFMGGAFQAFRVAGQRLVSQPVAGQRVQPSCWASPFSRVFLGTPVAALVLLYSLDGQSEAVVRLYGTASLAFWLWIGAAAITQLYATILQTVLVKQRNFAIGIMYLKIMLPGQAVFGVVFFAEHLSPLQWLAVGVATVGVLIMAQSKSSKQDLSKHKSSERADADIWDMKSLGIGLLAGIILAFTGLFVREANQALSADTYSAFSRGLCSLLALVTLQLIVCTVAISWRDRREFLALLQRYRVVLFTGLMSVAGSMCWFVAFALAHPALVNTVGQSEFLFAMLLSLYLFKERPSRAELTGMAVMLLAILVLLWP